MGKKSFWLLVLALFLAAPLLAGCGELGEVDQGRVIKFDREKGIVTLIQDKRAEPGKPDYNTLPPHTYQMPTDPHEIGALPRAGKRMNLDTKNKTITIFDTATQNFKTIPITVIDLKENVRRDNPLVANKDFPIIDRDKKTITIYSARQRILETFTVPDEYFALPDDTWEAGDEVRIYYHQAGKAQRFMNITKTDIFKK